MACPNSLRVEKARQVKSKVKSMLITFFVIKGVVHREFVLAGQAVILYTTVTLYGDCMKLCESFARTLATKELAIAS
jgi:hypothetical protein